MTLPDFISYGIIILGLTFTACKPGQETSNSGTNLMKYGIPYTIFSPKDVTVTKIGSGTLADVSVKNTSGYDLQIFMGSAFSNDAEKLRQEKKDIIISNPSFIKIVEEYDDGFLYEKRTDDDTRSYDFIIFKIQGDKEINFQCGNSREFTESEVKAIIKSIR